MKQIDEKSSLSTIDPAILAVKTDLYPKLWDPNTKKLNHNVNLRLKQVAQDFIRGFEYPLKIKDIILTGSIANYNWNQYSDIDLHVLVDYNEIPDEYLEAFKDYFDAKKQLWNKNHNIMILGHEVETYIQDINEPHHSTGVYSILHDKWLTEPSHKEQNIDYEDIATKTDSFIEQINSISQKFVDKDYDRAIEKVESLKKKLKKYRQAGLESGGEYSTENLVFKMLRNGGHLETLSNLKRQAYDQKMGIEEEIAIFHFQQTLQEVKKIKKKKRDACYYKARSKYKVWPSAYASGYLVKCRKKKGKIKEEEVQEEIELDEEFEIDEDLIEELSLLDEEETLRRWFSRQGGEGKSKGWVDCNTCRKDKSTGRKKCKSCGRQSGEKRSKYPACRPTPSQCTRAGMRRKKSSKQVSWKSKKEE